MTVCSVQCCCIAVLLYYNQYKYIMQISLIHENWTVCSGSLHLLIESNKWMLQNLSIKQPRPSRTTIHRHNYQNTHVFIISNDLLDLVLMIVSREECLLKALQRLILLIITDEERFKSTSGSSHRLYGCQSHQLDDYRPSRPVHRQTDAWL